MQARSVSILVLAGALLLAACGEEPRQDVRDARRAIEDYRISSVTFRAIDDFYPVAVVRHGGRVSPLPVASQAQQLSDETPVDIGAGSIPLAAALAATDTNALIVLHDGKVVYERYFNGADAGSRFIGWSISKSLVSLLAGVALERGVIDDLGDPGEKYWPALAGTAFEGATLEQLLRMRAGTSYREWTRYGTAEVDLLAEQSLFTNQKRFTDLSDVEVTRTSAPGTDFNYSTLTASVIGRILEEASGKSLATLTEEYLWKPAGMEADAYWMLDAPAPDGDEFGGGGFNAVARDFARVGLMALQDGSINDVQVVPQNWIAASVRHDGTEPVIPRTPRGYGYQWWTIVGTEIFEAVGIHGQFISVDPKTDSVIVKLSYWPGRGGGERENLMLMNSIRDVLD